MPHDLRKLPPPKPLSERDQRWLDARRKLPSDPQRYIAELEEIAQNAGPEHQIVVGRLYCTNSGLPNDYARAEEWFRLAAKRVPAKANWYLGLLLQMQKRFEESLDALKISAEQGYAPAYYLIGRRYYFGQGVPKNLTTAKAYLQRAFDLGSIPAGILLARMLYKERGLKTKLRGTFFFFRVISAFLKAKKKGQISEEFAFGLPKELIEEIE